MALIWICMKMPTPVELLIMQILTKLIIPGLAFGLNRADDEQNYSLYLKWNLAREAGGWVDSESI